MKKAPWCVDMNVCMHEEDGLIRETAPGLPSKVTLCQRLEYILRLWYDTKWQVQWQIFFLPLVKQNEPQKWHEESCPAL